MSLNDYNEGERQIELPRKNVEFVVSLSSSKSQMSPNSAAIEVEPDGNLYCYSTTLSMVEPRGEIYHQKRSTENENDTPATSYLSTNKMSLHHSENRFRQSNKRRKYTTDSIRFSDIIGHASVKLRIDELILPLGLPSDIAQSVLKGIRSIPASILLYGPPGCGKVSTQSTVYSTKMRHSTF
jgi:SpoVK/Ycf46/Vps4 family AAA+-type ATPase